MDNVKQKAFDFIDSHHEEMMSLWKKLVSIESGSLNKRGIDAVAEEIKNQSRVLLFTEKQKRLPY